MYKSGAIFAGAAFLLGVWATMISPLCTPGLALLLGLAAGLAVCVFDEPPEIGSSVKAGAVGGALGGIGASLGQLAGAGVNALVMGPEGAADLMRRIGVETGGAAGALGYWSGPIGSAVILGVLDVAFMAGMGVVGALLWWQITGKERGESATADTAAIIWNPQAMSTGVPAVDAQHQEWIRRYNLFEAAISHGKGIEAVQNTLDFFMSYVDTHFDFEESVMDEYHCPAATDNRVAHEQMRRILRGYNTYVGKHGFSISEVYALRLQMKEWLIKHILTIDIQLRDSVST